MESMKDLVPPNDQNMEKIRTMAQNFERQAFEKADNKAHYMTIMSAQFNAMRSKLQSELLLYPSSHWDLSV
jgi:hypothetical protein